MNKVVEDAGGQTTLMSVSSLMVSLQEREGLGKEWACAYHGLNTSVLFLNLFYVVSFGFLL